MHNGEREDEDEDEAKAKAKDEDEALLARICNRTA